MKCYTAPSLGGLEGTPEETWGVETYDPRKDRDKATVFVGLYDLRDYIALWRHKGKKYVFWCGSDIENLLSNFLLNDGKLKLASKVFGGVPKFFLEMLRNECSNYVEDIDEKEKLKQLKINARIIPSFLGKIEDFPVCYKQSENPAVYISGHPDRENEYGFSFIEELAEMLKGLRFHIYGADWGSDLKNVTCHGLVSKEQFNQDIRSYQSGLRLNEHDGFSEITAKSVLMGQYPITYLEYPMIPNFSNKEELIDLLLALKDMDKPNYMGSDYYRIHLNRFPWNAKRT